MKTILIDRELLNNLYGDCEESMTEVFTTYIAGYNEMKKNLSSAFCSGNLNSLRRLLHFHGPSYMYLGMPELADMFKKLERKCAEIGNHFIISADFTELLEAIESSFRQIKNEPVVLKKAV